MRWLTSELSLVRDCGARGLQLGFALGTFATCMFTLVPLLGLYAAGKLAGEFEGLNTLLGLAIFGLLWVLATVSTLCAVVQIGADPIGRDAGRVLLYATKWGAMGGLYSSLLISAAVMSALAFITLVEAGPLGFVFLVTLGLLGVIFGSAFAMVLGAFLGFAAGLLVVPLARIARLVMT